MNTTTRNEIPIQIMTTHMHKGAKLGKMVFIIDGKVKMVTPVPVLKDLGRQTKKRISHIVPHNDIPRLLLFRFLRWLFGETGRVAQWTRTWGCDWAVQWAHNPGVTVYCSSSRAACVAWEMDHMQYDDIINS